MGGIGKTTIAKSIFTKYFSQYDGCCFLANVKENYGKHENGLYDLRYKLASKLLEDEDVHVGSAAIEFPFVEYRLMRKKVFIVLDDVSSLRQFEYLIGGCHCFAPGSKIIITTRDKHVLSKGVDVIYKVKEWNFHESSVLFNLNAFNQRLPTKGYERLSERAIHYSKGIPLALKVLGSFFHDKSEDEWDSALRKLEKIPNQQIQEILKLSYDELDENEREIFLEIACFLKGQRKERVMSLLDSYGLYSAIGMKTLQDKALITIGHSVWMHDLTQEMGRQIVRQECVKDLGQRSRLWDPREAYDILANNKGTDKIEGIMIDVSQIKELRLSADTFKRMRNLRYLKIYSTSLQRSCNVQLPNDLESFSNKISYLEWARYPLKSLPSTFCPDKLVELHMPESNVEKLWDEVQDLVNLKRIDLRQCNKLMELPDFSKASNLEYANLAFCSNLRNIHPSILSLHSLVSLSVLGCIKLESLQSDIHLRSLSSLELRGCINLKKFSVSSKKIKALFAAEEIGILPASIDHPYRVEGLRFDGSMLQKIPDQLSCLSSLKSLDVYSCNMIDDMMLHILFDGLRSLERLYLVNCSNITELPNNTQHLLSLKYLDTSSCKRLRSLPKLPPFISLLYVDNCTSLKTVFPLKATRHKRCPEVISFQYCGNLDEQSFHNIPKYALSSAMKSLFRKQNYFEAWVPGRRVPEGFKYKTREASITIELPPILHLLGFLFCVVFNGFPLSGKFKVEEVADCKCYLGDSTYIGQSNCRYLYDGVLEMNLDHVILWRSRYGSDEILEGIEREIRNDGFPSNLMLTFIFSLRWNVVDESNVPVLNELIRIKECGVSPIFVDESEGNKKRSRDDYDDDDELELQQQLLSNFKKLKLDSAYAWEDGDNLESLLMRISIT